MGERSDGKRIEMLRRIKDTGIFKGENHRRVARLLLKAQYAKTNKKEFYDKSRDIKNCAAAVCL